MLLESKSTPILVYLARESERTSKGVTHEELVPHILGSLISQDARRKGSNDYDYPE